MRHTTLTALIMLSVIFSMGQKKMNQKERDRLLESITRGQLDDYVKIIRLERRVNNLSDSLYRLHLEQRLDFFEAKYAGNLLKRQVDSLIKDLQDRPPLRKTMIMSPQVWIMSNDTAYFAEDQNLHPEPAGWEQLRKAFDIVDTIHRWDTAVRGPIPFFDCYGTGSSSGVTLHHMPDDAGTEKYMKAILHGFHKKAAKKKPVRTREKGYNCIDLPRKGLYTIGVTDTAHGYPAWPKPGIFIPFKKVYDTHGLLLSAPDSAHRYPNPL